MATTIRKTNSPIVDSVLQNGHQYDFFQLVDLLQRLHGVRAKLGYQGPVAEEMLRLRPIASLAFPLGDVIDVRRITDHDDKERYQITSAFMGLYGTVSPLPTHYTEDIINLDSDESHVHEFLDLFHHRLLSLFFRAWTKYRYHVLFEEEGADVFSSYIFSLLGLGTSGQRDKIDFPTVRLIRYAGVLTQRPRCAVGLQGMLTDFFEDTLVSIEQGVGSWFPIDPTDQNRFGQTCCSLGQDMLLGERVFDRSAKFRIKLGPVDFEKYQEYLPIGERFKHLQSLTRLYLVDWLDFDLGVKLFGDEVPPLQLSSNRHGTRLGWTSWLCSQPSDDVEVILQSRN